MNKPAHNILVIIAYVQIPLINTHADVSSRARGLIFVYASSKGSGKCVQIRPSLRCPLMW